MKIVRAERPLKEGKIKPIRFGWPLGLNQSMDEHAAYFGFGHWSCISPHSNELWLRRDGEHALMTFGPGGYTDELRKFDRTIPVRKPLPMFRGKTNWR